MGIKAARRTSSAFRSLGCLVLAIGIPAASASCSSCEIDCGGTPNVQAEVAGLPEGTRVEICFDDDCAVVPTQLFGGGSPIALRDIPDGTFQPNQQFEVRLTLLDDAAGTVGTLTETRSFAKGSCSCLDFPYRWNGSGFDRWK